MSRHDRWNEQDLASFERRGVSVTEIERQLELLRHPPASVELVRPATVGDGIIVIGESDQRRQRIARAEEAAARGRVTKFVPASGAATRMFAELAPALDPNGTLNGGPARFFRDLTRFPFFEDLEDACLSDGIHLDSPLTDDEKRGVLRRLLTDEGLSLGSIAKGLIPFHDYGPERRTAFEEQLREGARFASDGERIRMHFTVSHADLGRFSTILETVAPAIRSETGATPEVSFSVQHPATDTIALDPEGEPFRDDDGGLLFRPGGHGALLRNLHELDADLVLIKNIDNVRPAGAQVEVARWYQILIGHLLTIEERVHSTIRALDTSDETAIARAHAFVAELGRPWRGDREDHDGARRHLRDALDRPLRVCAVVRNEGEPGGAPFWIRDARGRESLQIIESSQIDMTRRGQARIFRSSTHFNPVAIACSLRDVRGRAFDLPRYVDHDAAFVANKTHRGRELRALEHPGLWNGAMAEWNSVFVEVPASTFAPVKTVFDLLRDEHQTEIRRT